MGICFRTICIFCCRMIKIWRHLQRQCLSRNTCILLTCLKAAICCIMASGKNRGKSTKQRFITRRTDWWLLGIKCGAYNHLERINRERWRQNEAVRSTSAQSRARLGKLFMCAQWRYWGILTFLSGLHKMDKSFPSLNMLSILNKAPRHPLYNHRHPQCIRTQFFVNLVA